MGRLAVSAVGLAIGFAFGAPGIGLAIGNIIGALLFPVKQPDIVGPRIQELQVKSSAYGNPIPIHYAHWRTGTEVTWSTELKETTHREKVGGKGFGGGQARISFTYSVSFETHIGEGVIGHFARIWAGPKLIYDARTVNEGPVSQFLNNISFYKGTEIQLPDPEVEADKGIANVPADRGVSKLHFNDLPLADFGNTEPAISVEVFVKTVVTRPITNFEGVTFSPSSEPVMIARSFDRSIIYLLWAEGPDDLNPAPVLRHRQVKIQKIDPATFDIIQENIIDAVPHDIFDEPALTRPGAFGFLLDTFTVDSFGDIYTSAMWGNDEVSFLMKIDGEPLEFIKQVKVSTGTRALVPGNFEHPITHQLLTTSLYTGGIFASAKLLVISLDLDILVQLPGVNFPSSSIVVAWTDAQIDLDGNAWYVGDSVVDDTIHFIRVDSTGVSTFFNITNPEPGAKLQFESITPFNTVTFDSFTNSLMLFMHDPAASPDTHSIYRFSIDSLSIDGSLVDYFINNFFTVRTGESEYTNLYYGHSTVFFTIRLDPGDFLRVFELDPVNMVITRDAESGWTPASIFEFYGEQKHGIVTASGSLLLDRADNDEFDSASTTVRDVVEDLLDRAGFVSADYDINPLDDLWEGFLDDPGFHKLHGYSVKSRGSIRNSLEELAEAYMFTLIESDWKIKAIDRKGDSPSGTIIPIVDMGAYERGQKPPKAVSEIIQQEIEIPERVDVIFISEIRDYQEGSVHSKRISALVNTREEVTRKFNINLSVEQAKQISEFLLYQAWISRDSYSFTLPPQYIRIDPGDYLQIPVGGVNTRIFVETVEYGVSGLIRITGTRDDSEVFQSTTLGKDALPPVISNNSFIIIPPPSTLLNFDIPLLRDVDEDAGFYQGASGPNGYTGTIVDVSEDGGSTWEGLFTYVKSQISFTGFAVGKLSPGPTTIFDNINTLTVRFFNDSFTFQSTTEATLLINKELNAFLTRDEIIRFQTAVDNGDGTWTFSKLIRGARGTEHEIDNHAAGDRVTLLTKITLTRVSDINANIGIERLYRATSINSVTIALGSIPFASQAKGLWPYSPVHIISNKDVTGRTITWVRRARIDHEMRNNADVPLDEVTEDYVVAILDNDGNELRAITTTASANGSVVTPLTQTAFYAVEDEQLDFGLSGVDHAITIPSGIVDLIPGVPTVIVSSASTFEIIVPSGLIRLTANIPGIDTQAQGLLINVYQISSIVGRGFPGEKRI